MNHNLKKGTKVKVLKELKNQAHNPSLKIPEGTIAYIQKQERIQEGKAFYSCWAELHDPFLKAPYTFIVLTSDTFEVIKDESLLPKSISIRLNIL